MRRRKVLIGMGALTAGGAAAFGTEAFSTVQAERNVDVAVAGDQNAFVAIQPMSGKNAEKYVSTEDDNTVELNFDGDNSGSGQGVNQDGITDFEDLFRVINQGSQTTSVYFEDDSDAVTFRVTESTDTETAGVSGQSLEGADNSVELGVGEQVIVGLTVDTLNNDVSGDLLDDVTLWAEPGAAAPEQGIPKYVVDGQGSDPNTFVDLSSALGSSDVSSGSVIGIEATSSISESSQISVDDSVTIVGVGGTSIIDVTGHTSDGGAIQINADDVTLQNFELQYSGQSSTATNAIEATDLSGLTIDGLTVDNKGSLNGNPAINAEGVNSLTITDNTVTDGNIGISHSDSSSETITVSGNYVNANSGGSDTVPEGIFVGYETGGDISNKQFEIKNNLIENSASGSADIKVGPSSNLAGDINGQTGKQAQLESLLTENDISRAQVDDGTASDGTLVTESLSAFSSIQSAIDTATTDGVTLVDSGSYTESVNVPSDGLKLKGISNPVIEGEAVNSGDSSVEKQSTINIQEKTTGVTVEGFTIRNPDGYYGVYVGSGSGSPDIDQNEVIGNTIEKVATNIGSFSPSPVGGGASGVYLRGNHDNSLTVKDNIIQDVDTTSGSGVNAVGISLKSFSDNVTAKGANVENNLIKNIAGSDRNKGISVNGDYENVTVVGNTINGLSGSSGAAALKAITLGQNKSFAPDSDPDSDTSDEWLGPVNFTVKENEVRSVNGVPGNSWGIAIGNYEELDSTISGGYGSGRSTYFGVENNNIVDTDVAVGIGRYNADEGGVNPGDSDILQVQGNYYGAADGPSGEDTNGTLSGSGAPLATVDFDEGNDSVVEIKGGQSNYSSSANSNAGSSL